ncbi:DNA repair protein RecN [Ruminococcus difficilis]|uniref:DNA repair protein RecN n=1 Tax=Ruminococcus difficilis TaxID=2763069 RepID=A0A934U3Z8_9FIRM|nr:DNA repair protein RecN [Ruminococcus difficilis]MBK6088104.1 DNA repair protein RecN [Ruminococcus difficilis]
MLTNLYIENIAVIEKSNIDFTNGLNVLTGETGAGKSIVIDAINAVLGKRSSRGMIRTGADAAYVSATFEELSELVHKKLGAMGYSAEDGSLILSRELSVSGKNTCRINSRPATVAALKELGEYLINIHGQNDNLELMNPALHIVYIDALADIGERLAAYRGLYRELKAVEEELNSADTDESERLRRMDLLSFQITELEDADITVGEYDALSEERNALQNREKIAKELMRARIALDGDDEADGVLRMTDDAATSVMNASRYLSTLEGAADRLSSALYELQEISRELEGAMDDIDADPHRLEEIEERLDLLYRLRHKYGDSEEEMLAYLDNAKKELNALSDYAFNREQLEKRREELYNNAYHSAKELSDIRKKVCETFRESVEREMAFLLMPDVRLEIRHEEVEMNTRGIDKIEFLISVNPGEEPKPVSKIASGGELSRMMLAIKTVLSRADFVQTLIFDEIDTGISGSAADRVGKKLHQLSADSQVLCVTHQAQIAAFADNHLFISKSVHDERTFTQVDSLDEEGRVRELARIVGGEQITDSALNHAKQLLEAAKE